MKGTCRTYTPEHVGNKRTLYSTSIRERMIWTVPESLRHTSGLLAVELWLIRTLIIIVVTQVNSVGPVCEGTTLLKPRTDNSKKKGNPFQH